jgi:CHAT domain-containing protein
VGEASAYTAPTREFGGRLFEHLFADEVLTAFRTCRMDLGSGEHLRIRLRMPDQLATLPWELLYDKERRQFLVLDNDLSLVRYPHVSRQVKPLRVDGPLQILAVLASPDDPINYRPIRVDHELRRVEDALRTAIQRRHVELGVIRGYNTLQKLRDRLRQPVPVHILHVLSHGELHEDSGECVLIFEDVDGAADPINAEVLKLAIEKNQGQTRLVLLNACLGALPVGNDPFSSIGAALAQGGVPAVIAMQFELADDAAADLAQIFYAELAGGMAIDVALREARQHLYTRNRSRLDWVVPVLYLHSEDGNLFEGVWVDHGARGWTTNILAEIEQAERQHQWVTAVELLERYCRHRPEDEYAGKRLAHARAEHELDLLAQKSRARIDAHDWEGALAALSEIWKIRPAYTHPAIDLAALREHAHAEQRMVRVTAEILTAEEQHNWKHAIILLEEYLQRRPEDDQARNRLSRAQMEAERERLLQIAHEQLVRLREGLESSDGQARVAAFDQLVSLVQKPDPYPEAVVLLAQQIEQPRLPFEQRLRAGQLVAVLGDTRPGVTTLPPAMAPLTSSVEFARYPTSVAQFRTFVQDGGYDPERAWWRPMSRQWLLAVQVAEPAFWQDERFGQRRLNHPVVGVSWFEAEAFCAWLTQSRQYNPEGLVYRLPTSAEWQQAAQGSERRDYAWGAEAPNAERANFAETQAGTTPLGCYIHGITPTSHVHDLAGNVWEWTSTIYQPSPSARATPLSIHEPAADHSFVVRGGCWRSPSPLLRTHHYYHYSPDYSSTNLGFRIVRIVKTTTSNDRL